MFNDLSIFTLINKGGVTLWILVLLSVVSVGVMTERVWFFFKFKKSLRFFLEQMRKEYGQRGLKGVESLCNISLSPLSRIVREGLVRIRYGKAGMEEAMELAGRKELLGLERYLGILGTIGNIAPFVGLLGTVLGIISAFRALSAAQGVGPAVVADGIAEALIATAAGLFVAIPAVVAFNYFTRKVSSISMDVESGVSEFLDMAITGCEQRNVEEDLPENKGDNIVYEVLEEGKGR